MVRLGHGLNPAPEPDLPCVMTETLVSWSSRSAGSRGRPALLEASGLTRSSGPLTMLRQVSLQVFRGEIVAIPGAGGPEPAWADHDRLEQVFANLENAASHGASSRGTDVTEMAGTGLGLPIARGIVEARGGTLVLAAADPGASFVVTLPAEPPPGDTREPAGASCSAVEEPEEQGGG